MKNALGHDDQRAFVRDAYQKVATLNGSSTCCAPSSPSCCGPVGTSAEKLGYSGSQEASVPEGSNLGLGCGNPTAIASLRAGEVVVDLGSGAGFDCFLAARAVGSTGRVIGVDMTPEMISKARKNATAGGYTQVEFRLGEIEHLPVADNFADILISNCVINLSPDKRSVVSDAFRILKPGGRLAISDIVATEPLPPEIRDDPGLLCGCMSGATPMEELRQLLHNAGFDQIEIIENPGSREFIRDWAPERGVEKYLAAATIKARKPNHRG
jgi:arsenite methyltransferase